MRKEPQEVGDSQSQRPEAALPETTHADPSSQALKMRPSHEIAPVIQDPGKRRRPSNQSGNLAATTTPTTSTSLETAERTEWELDPLLHTQAKIMMANQEILLLTSDQEMLCPVAISSIVNLEHRGVPAYLLWHRHLSMAITKRLWSSTLGRMFGTTNIYCGKKG
jgi:hypothetical protein